MNIKECLKEWAKTSFATHLPWRAVPGEITEFSEKNSKVSVYSVAKPTDLDTAELQNQFLQ